MAMDQTPTQLHSGRYVSPGVGLGIITVLINNMTMCAMCNKEIPAKEMQKSRLSDILGDNSIWGDIMDMNYKLMPNVMEEIAMKCNRCGTWICNKCVVKTVEHSPGMIQHDNCGGMFETP